VSPEDEIVAELERRLRAPLDPVPPPKRSYSPAPTSGPVSISPAEAHLRDSLWRWLRKQAPVAALVVVLGGGSSYVGGDAQDGAQRETVEALQADMAKLRKAFQEAQGERDELAEELRKTKRELGTTREAHEALAKLVRELQAQVNKLEEAKTVVVRAQADRPPAAPH
jgi:uncharacterized protein HemX